MLTEYIAKALAEAKVEQLEDGEFFASIPRLKGVFGNGATEDEAKRVLAEVLDEWLVIQLREDEEIPELDGVSLNFGGKKWSGQLRAASSSGN